MNTKFTSLLNIKPGEASLVKQLLTVQFFLGIATSFLSTSAITVFLSKFDSHEFPKVLLVAAAMLFLANYAYAWLEEHLSAKKLLQAIILFSSVSVSLTWVAATFFSFTWLPFFEAAWNMIIYMVVGYAFWGMAAIMFNVRESKRLFSVVGSGDIPAKIIGYASVGLLAPFIGVENLFLVSVAAFFMGSYYLKGLHHHAITEEHSAEHAHGQPTGSSHGHGTEESFFKKVFHNRFIFSIALWSFLSYLIFLLLDFTFLADIKSTYHNSPALASFIGLFFAVGRVLAILFKLLFSSRVISRVGLVNTLLISPAILAGITGMVFWKQDEPASHLYLFGAMVLLSEVLKSAVQDPAFFILFQPLKPHDRLKGHLITKGYTMPFALVGIGAFAYAIMGVNGRVSILLICQAELLLLAVWVATVFLIRKEYYHTLINALQKGFFTGTTLFLHEEPVRNFLLEKVQSPKPKEVVVALELLERSRYNGLEALLLKQLSSPYVLVQKHVLAKVIELRLLQALPLVEEMLARTTDLELKLSLLTASFALSPQLEESRKAALQGLNQKEKKAALLGIAVRKDTASVRFREDVLHELAQTGQSSDKKIVLDVLAEATEGNHDELLTQLLADPDDSVSKKAMEVIGLKKNFRLLDALLETAVARKFYPTVQKALSNYGDAVFEKSQLYGAMVSKEAVPYVVKAAARQKGMFSTQYLLQLLVLDTQTKDRVIDALWIKKEHLAELGQVKLVEGWLQAKLTQSNLKVGYYKSLKPVQEAHLLATALKSEVEQDVLSLLQGCALLYERSRIDRVMDLVTRGDHQKLSNAIEMLELLVPTRYFVQIDALLEFLQDCRTGARMRSTRKEPPVSQAITEILTSDAPGCTSWTKSVAYYVLPGLEKSWVPDAVWQETPREEDPLLQETYQHTLSLIK